MPSFNGGDDFVWVCGPSEWLGIVVGLVEEPIDGSLEFMDRPEDTTLEAPTLLIPCIGRTDRDHFTGHTCFSERRRTQYAGGDTVATRTK
jgi:hypothetical protein